MHPTLIEFSAPLVGQVAVPSYLSLLLIGYLGGVWLARREGERRGLDGTRVVDLGLLMLALGLVGARLLSVLADGHLDDFIHLCTDPHLVPAIDSRVPYCSAEHACDFHYVCDLATNRCHPPRDCLAALKFWHGGLTFYGGLLLAVPGGMYFAKRTGLGAWRMADIGAPGVMFGLAVGRVGCFLNGCCYGVATDAWVGVAMSPASDPAHPTQLYESLGCLAIFALLMWVIRPRLRPARAAEASPQVVHGAVFGAMLVLYGVLRAVIEVYRADPRGALGPLSTSQAISLPLIALGVYLLVRARSRARQLP